MRTLTLFFLAIVISAGSAFSQPIKDKAIIPIGVTLNSMLRLNVTSGGAIEFVFNTLDDYTNGINEGFDNTLYQTEFTVASSSDFDVLMYADNANFIGSDNSANTIDVGYLEYQVTHEGTGATGDLYSTTFGVATSLDATATTQLIIGTSAAGDIAQNAFAIAWAMGRTAGTSGSLLGKGFDTDRYVVNVIMELSAK